MIMKNQRSLLLWGRPKKPISHQYLLPFQYLVSCDIVIFTGLIITIIKCITVITGILIIKNCYHTQIPK